MEKEWLKHLSTKGEHIVPVMEKYFNGNISFEEMNKELILLDESLNYNKFKRIISIEKLSS